MTQTDKIKNLVSAHRVKLHIFQPSNKKIWTVVGTDKEYWTEPRQNFCSCPSYYFGKLNEKKGCYHLEALRSAQQKNKIELVFFVDEEYVDFISSLLYDL